MPPKSKKAILKKLQSKVYLIYGIFDFKNEELIYISLDEADVELKFDLEGYDDEDFGVITVKIMVE